MASLSADGYSRNIANKDFTMKLENYKQNCTRLYFKNAICNQLTYSPIKPYNRPPPCDLSVLPKTLLFRIANNPQAVVKGMLGVYVKGVRFFDRHKSATWKQPTPPYDYFEDPSLVESSCGPNSLGIGFTLR